MVDDTVVDLDVRSAIRTRAIGLLARREHSRAELQDKLQRRDYPPRQVVEVLTALQHEGLVNDRRFAEQFVHARQQRGQGVQRIRRELRERGVDGELIEQALAGTMGQDWMAQLRAVQRKRFGRLPQDARERARQARFLYYRGYTAEQVNRLFRMQDDDGWNGEQ
ncbi:MAG: regulatory protein RecX [Gammaproteobacteria bacterium]|nr:regulatory protein RecX [Gammaproteobacteria bacterium]